MKIIKITCKDKYTVTKKSEWAKCKGANLGP